ncbi:HAD family hydrolase [Deinococcus puniceus]|uniref:Haloacid dehalogenase n=1 Tax=Deinococcus puniceus TaxID=1182568 RepID=A0A172T7S0_9DEIO|nr:HAD family hydrolase [Deinococcus puniceus]ANE42986.1 haloacid dehalogenase [Deinococcus puniceus]
MTPVRAVLFDLDGTLHDRNATVQSWLSGHMERFGLPAGYAERFTELDDFGYRAKREVFPDLIGEFGLLHDSEQLFQDFATHFLTAPALMPYAVNALDELRAAGIRIGVVTNGWKDVQTACLEGCGLRPLVDDVVISKEVGLSKPDPRIYTLALERLGVSAAETWFVGDSPKNDVWRPQQVGMRAAFLPTGHALNGETPDAVLRDLRDVLRLEGLPVPI